MMMVVLQDIFPLDLWTHSTYHLADTSACISTTSWIQKSGVYRRVCAHDNGHKALCPLSPGILWVYRVYYGVKGIL